MPIGVQNLAMHIYNIFFLRKSYMNYDRETILNTCILLAAKSQNNHELTSKILVSN
jgi:hypothetical protein